MERATDGLVVTIGGKDRSFVQIKTGPGGDWADPWPIKYSITFRENLEKFLKHFFPACRDPEDNFNPRPLKHPHFIILFVWYYAWNPPT